MNRQAPWAFCVLLTATTALTAAGPSKRPVALILAVDGKVIIHSLEKKDRPAEALGSVRAGETTTIPAGASLTFQFRKDGHVERLAKAGEAAITIDGCEPKSSVEKLSPPTGVGNVVVKNVPRLTGLSQAGSTSARGRPAEPLPQLTPIVGATVLDARPTLKWPAAKDAVEYEVVLSTVGQRVWGVKTKRTTASIAADVPLESAFTYEWEVVGAFPEAKGKETTVRRLYIGRFVMATIEQTARASELKHLAAQENAVWLAIAARGYEEMSAYAEAIAAYEKLVRLSPQCAPFHAALAELYQKAGRTGAEAKAKEAATRLGFKFNF